MALRKRTADPACPAGAFYLVYLIIAHLFTSLCSHPSHCSSAFMSSRFMYDEPGAPFRSPRYGSYGSPYSDDSQEVPVFQYDKLDKRIPSIRLLNLHMREQGIVCTMETVDLRQAPAYEVLSYCWSPHTNNRTIMINGCSHKVSQNLFTALERLKQVDNVGHSGRNMHHAPVRRLWIDAICINQEDMSERSRQDQLMWAINSKAAKVLAWLGDEENDSDIGKEVSRLLACQNESFLLKKSPQKRSPTSQTKYHVR